MRQIQQRRRVVALFVLVALVDDAALVVLALTGVLDPITSDVWLVGGVFVLVFGLATLFIAGTYEVEHQRMLRLARGNVHRLVPVVLPDDVAAGVDGPSVVLARRGKNRTIIALLIISCVNMLLILTAFLFRLPTWTTFLIFLGYVLVLVIPVLIVVVTDTAKTAVRQAIVADAMGITVQRGKQAPQQVMWADVLAIYQATPGQAAATAGTYCIITRDVMLEVAPYVGAGFFNEKTLFEGGDDAASYEAQAQRLLRMMATRGVVPMTKPLNSYAKQVYGITAEEALTLPVADAALQPDAAPDAQMALPTTVTPAIEAKHFTYVFLVAPVLFLTILLIAGGLVWYLLGGWKSLSPLGFDWTLLIFGSVLLVFMAVFYLFLYYADQVKFRVSFPRMVADEIGLTARITRRAVKTVHWAEARVWSVQPQSDGKLRYRLYGTNTVLQWDEDERMGIKGTRSYAERNAAYRQQMSALHATIVARTGLSLREDREETRSVG